MERETVVRIAVLPLAALLLAGCLSGNGGTPPPDGLTGTVQIDGSSTVFPITEAVGEEFQKLHGGVRVTVGISGTGGGFKKFCAGETDISDASRLIKGSEKEACAKDGVEWVELKVAYDGLSVGVNPQNTFASCITVQELKRIWEPGSTVQKWSDVRPQWPGERIKLFGPGTDSGTFDYFTEAVVGKEDASRADYTASEDDNVLVQGISGERYALGYFGYAYYVENQDKLKLVAVDGGKGCILPSERTINDGTYSPLSRPIFIYANKKSLQRPEVREFARYYLTEGTEFISQVGYIKMPEAIYQEGLRMLAP